MHESLLEIRGLTIEFAVDKVRIPAVRNVDLRLEKGEILALVGESGSGKSTLAMAIPGLLTPNARLDGSIRLAGEELARADEQTLTEVRGGRVGVVFQEPMTAFNPVYTIGWQITEAIQMHRDMTKEQARARAVELLELVDMPDPATRIDYYPHQLSGGQRQRAMIAQALACDPALLIADEPTTALDVTVQSEILDLIRDLRTRVDAGILLITHDIGVVADIADRIMVMKDGGVVESGSAQTLFSNPTHPYTRALLNAVPHLGAGRLQVSEPVTAAGEVVGLVGESGSGKSTLGKAAVALVKLTSGSAHLAGIDITGLSQRGLREPRRRVGVVFQDPGSSLDPRWPTGQAIAEPLALHTSMSRDERSARVDEPLEQVHLDRRLRNRYPRQLSGGQRQRVGIARALALNPALVIADEPTSALDVSVQARVPRLLRALQADHGFACLFISHDLAVIEELSDRIAVMQSGKLVESGPAETVLNHPTESYTARLIASVPVPDPAEQARRRQLRLAQAAR